MVSLVFPRSQTLSSVDTRNKKKNNLEWIKKNEFFSQAFQQSHGDWLQLIKMHCHRLSRLHLIFVSHSLFKACFVEFAILWWAVICRSVVLNSISTVWWITVCKQFPPPKVHLAWLKIRYQYLRVYLLPRYVAI